MFHATYGTYIKIVNNHTYTNDKMQFTYVCDYLSNIGSFNYTCDPAEKTRHVRTYIKFMNSSNHIGV